MLRYILFYFFMVFVMITTSLAEQHDYVVNNGPGATVRADINAGFQAIVTNNSGAVEPATMYPNMWWFDTSTGLLKRRNNANDAWITVGLEATDTDGTLAANSDSKIATQKATKTYADGKISKTTSAELSAMTAKATLAENDVFLIEDSAASYSKKKVLKSNLISISGYTEKTSLADDDVVLIEDSADSYAKKKVKSSNIVRPSVVGDYLAYGDDDEISQVNKGTPQTGHSVVVPRPGALRIKFSGKGVSGHHGYYRIYRNSVAVGTLNDNTTNSYVLYSEDITGWSSGDLLELKYWVDVTDGQYQYIKEFRIYEDIPPDYSKVN